MSGTFAFKGGCRGNGKLYQLFHASDGHDFTVKCTSPDGGVLPAALLGIGSNDYVAIFADFAIVQTFLITDESGRVVFKGTNRPFIRMLESKVNGVVAKSLCRQIRNVDYAGSHSLPVITLKGLAPCREGVILRVDVSSGLMGRCSKVVAFNARGNRIGECAVSASPRAATTSCSITVSDFNDFLTLSIVDSTGKQNGVFSSYKKNVLREYWKATERRYRNAYNDPFYHVWLSENLIDASTAAEQREADIASGPLFSVIVPLYKTPLNFFREMADSVLAQTYSYWELVLVNSTPEIPELRDLVSAYASSDERIKVVELESNLGITENTAAGIKIAMGDYCCFFDHDDVLEPDILFEYAKAVVADPSIDLLYCDEDKLYPDGTLANPTFKPDFSLDMVRDNNYICHLLTVKTSVMQKIEPSGKELDGAQDHAMVLKIAELGGTIHHVPKMLYHWRISESSTAGNSDSKPYATEAGIHAVQQHLDRCGLSAKVECAHGRAFRYAPHYQIPDSVTGSVILAVADLSESFELTVSAVCSGNYCPDELVVICPCSCEERVRDVVAGLPCRVIVCGQSGTFNENVWRNKGAAAASGDVLVFLDDGALPMGAAWLENLIGFALRDDIGVVGTMSCDSAGIIRQAGLSHVGDSIVRLSRGLYREDPGYIYFPLTVRDVFAVDGSCQAFSRRAFSALGGYDEGFDVAYGDIDICLKASAEGMKVIYTPESAITRWDFDAYSDSLSSLSAACIKDKSRLLSKWSDVLAADDPWFSPYFSRDPRLAELYKLDCLDQWMG